jgi:bifunctional DNase/RNase
LNEVDGERKLPIVIAFEAQSIAIALEKEIKPPRPLTHDLFKILQSVLILLLSKSSFTNLLTVYSIPVSFAKGIK